MPLWQRWKKLGSRRASHFILVKLSSFLLRKVFRTIWFWAQSKQVFLLAQASRCQFCSICANSRAGSTGTKTCTTRSSPCVPGTGKVIPYQAAVGVGESGGREIWSWGRGISRQRKVGWGKDQAQERVESVAAVHAIV